MLVTAVGGSLVALVFARVIARSQAPDAAACVADGAAQDGDDAACPTAPTAPTAPTTPTTPTTPTVVLPPAASFGAARAGLAAAGSGLGAAGPGVTVALFIDLGSAASRQVFQQVTRAVGGGHLDVPAELRLLHAPAGGCGPGSRSPGCLGARAVECVERLAPGTGVRAAGAVFDLQWRPDHARGLPQILAAVAGESDAEALADCVARDRQVDERLAAHAALAARHGLAAAPGGFVLTTGPAQAVAPFGDWLTEAALRAIVRCLAQGRCEEAA